MFTKVVQEVDCYRAAWALIKDHGGEAADICESEAERSRSQGDLLSVITWRAIKGAVSHYQGRRLH